MTDITGRMVPKGWQRCALPDFTRIVMGQSPSSKTYNRGGDGIPFFQGKAEFGDISPTINQYCSQPKKIAEQGATLLSVRAPVGPTNLADRACCIGRGLAALHPCGGIESKFLLYLFRSIELEISGKGTGTTFSSINKGFVENLEFNLPPLAEQIRIVGKIEELLSELDKGIDSLQATCAQLNIYRQAVLKRAFEGNLTAQWREENGDKLQTPKQLLGRIKQKRTIHFKRQLEEWNAAVLVWQENGRNGSKPSKPRMIDNFRSLSFEEFKKLPPLPIGHVYTYLANLGELERGKSKHRPRNAPELFGGPYPFIQTAEVKAASRIVREYSKTYSELGLQQSKLWPEGTLCITIAANIAETAFLGFEGCFPDSVVGFKAIDGVVLNKYVELFIKSVRTRIEAYAPATAQKNINLSTLEGLVVPLCSTAEQQVLVDELEAVLSVIDDKRETIDEQLLKTETLRRSILHLAFSGQLVPQDPNDEPTSELLARIRVERQAALASISKKKNVRRRQLHPNSGRQGG